MVLPVRVEHALDVAVQCLHHADPRMHQEVATFGGTDQALDRGLPVRQVLFGLRQLPTVDPGGPTLPALALKPKLKSSNTGGQSS
jgi:hypothetical protein